MKIKRLRSRKKTKMDTEITQCPNCIRNTNLESIRLKERVDGRRPNSRREFLMTEIMANYLFEVSADDIRIHCRVQAEIVAPKTAENFEGIISAHVDLTSMSKFLLSNETRYSKQIELESLLERSLRDSNCLDLRSMRVKKTNFVFKLDLFLNVFECDGAVPDYLMLCAMFALGKCNVHVGFSGEMHMLPSPLVDFPFVYTLAIYDDGHLILVDPTLTEERNSEGLVTIGINRAREVFCYNYKGIKTETSLINKMAIAAAEEQTSQLYNLFKHIFAPVKQNIRI